MQVDGVLDILQKRDFKLSHEDIIWKSTKKNVIQYVINYINQKKLKVNILVVINQVRQQK